MFKKMPAGLAATVERISSNPEVKLSASDLDMGVKAPAAKIPTKTSIAATATNSLDKTTLLKVSMSHLYCVRSVFNGGGGPPGWLGPTPEATSEAVLGHACGGAAPLRLSAAPSRA